MPKQTVIEWITDPNTCFLLGAGASACASKPLIAGLTTKVRADICAETTTLLDSLDRVYGRDPTVEDLINQLQHLEKLLSGRKSKVDGYWTAATIATAIDAIQQSIVKHVGIAWTPSAVHGKFLQRLSLQRARTQCDVFTLNYDTLIEATLENACIPYIDGFWGAEAAYFDDRLYEREQDGKFRVRLHKLHGSINWIRTPGDGTVRRHPCAAIKGGDRVVIYPAEQKYYLTQYGVYELLITRFRARLRQPIANNKLVVIGYSFNDDHINEAILDSANAVGSNLSVLAFVGPETDQDAQAARLQKLCNRCGARFNMAVGTHSFIGAALNASEWTALKSKDLWKFENLTDLIAGA